jgi:hypothetical protein
LNLGRAGVFFVLAEFCDQLLFHGFCDRHNSSLNIESLLNL